jgi:hypothetical protein
MGSSKYQRRGPPCAEMSAKKRARHDEQRARVGSKQGQPPGPADTILRLLNGGQDAS